MTITIHMGDLRIAARFGRSVSHVTQFNRELFLVPFSLKVI